MIIFIIALIVLISAILVNMLQPLKKNRVLIMSILAILMIMVNFINQIDIIISPPQYIIQLDTPQSYTKKQVHKLNFKQQFQNQQMRYNNQFVQQFNKELQTYSKLDETITQQQIKQTRQLVSNLPLKSHLKPIIKSQINLIQILKNKLISNQDFILHINQIQKLRFQSLIQFFVKDINDKIDSYGLKFQKLKFIPIYNSYQFINRYYKFNDKLSDKDHHMILVFDKPSQKLLQFIYQSYTQKKPQYLSVIFLQLNQKINLFPISSFIETINYPQQINYIQTIKQLMTQDNQKQQNDKKQFKQTIKKIQKQLQTCQKYIDIDYEILLKLYLNKPIKSIPKICYQIVNQPVSKQIQCLRNIIQTQDQSIPLYKAQQCWLTDIQPRGINIFNQKIKLKKQYFWSNKISPSNFGLEVLLIKNQNQL